MSVGGREHPSRARAVDVAALPLAGLDLPLAPPDAVMPRWMP